MSNVFVKLVPKYATTREKIREAELRFSDSDNVIMLTRVPNVGERIHWEHRKLTFLVSDVYHVVANKDYCAEVVIR